jgi:hypothetical protein
VVGSVLLLVALGDTLARELALLPHRNETRAESQRKSRAKEEATALKTNNNVDAAVLADSRVESSCDLEFQRAHKVGEVGVVGEDGHDVLEEDAGRGEIGELAQGGAEVYFKTGEFGGTGGIGGGESSLGAMAGVGGGIRLAGGRVRGSRGAVDVLGGGSGVVGVAVRRVLSVGDRSAAHIEGGREGKIAGGMGDFWWASWCVSLCEGVRSAVQGPTGREYVSAWIGGRWLGDTGRVVFRLSGWMVVVLQRGCASCLVLSLSPEWDDFFEGFSHPCSPCTCTN